ncbi:MAG TPA: hypothetical protein VGN22_04795, partial [Pseudonocardia sp.]
MAGAPVARRLVREAAAAGAGVRRVDIIATGGHGKTVLLEAMSGAFRDAGIAVRHDVPAPGDLLAPDSALLVDDTHLLSPAELDRLAEVAATPHGYVVVAHRPWPRPAGTAALGATLAVSRPPVVLDALDRAGVSVRAGLLLDSRPGMPEHPPAELVDQVLVQTAGSPALVDRLLTALVEQAGPDRTRLGAPSRPPAGLLAQLGYAVHGLGSGVRGLLLARALGASLEAEVLVPLLGLPDRDGAAQLDEFVEAARAAGLLTVDGMAVPLVSAAVLAHTPQASHVEMRRALAEIELNRGGNVLAAARGLLAAGASGARVAAV